MAKRETKFINEDYYHIFNRGVDKRNIFMDQEDYKYFLERLVDFNSTAVVGGVYMQDFTDSKKLRSKASKLVDIVAYCILPNHFHLIVKQREENGIPKFMQRVGTGYVKYFNKKYGRSGSLFQGKFKSTYLDKEYSLDLTSAYVNLNYKHHGMKWDNKKVFSSLKYFIGEKDSGICTKQEINKIVSGFGGVQNYKNYLRNQSKYFVEKKGLNEGDVDYNELEK